MAVTAGSIEGFPGTKVIEVYGDRIICTNNGEVKIVNIGEERTTDEFVIKDRQVSVKALWYQNSRVCFIVFDYTIKKFCMLTYLCKSDTKTIQINESEPPKYEINTKLTQSDEFVLPHKYDRIRDNTQFIVVDDGVLSYNPGRNGGRIKHTRKIFFDGVTCKVEFFSRTVINKVFEVCYDKLPREFSTKRQFLGCLGAAVQIIAHTEESTCVVMPKHVSESYKFTIGKRMEISSYESRFTSCLLHVIKYQSAKYSE